MSCNKMCKCIDCEMMDWEHSITIVDDRNPFNTITIEQRCFKCRNNGQIALRLNDLKNSEIRNDLFFLSMHSESIKELEREK